MTRQGGDEMVLQIRNNRCSIVLSMVAMSVISSLLPTKHPVLLVHVVEGGGSQQQQNRARKRAKQKALKKKEELARRLQVAIERSLNMNAFEESLTITSNFIQDEDILYELANKELWSQQAATENTSTSSGWLNWNGKPNTIWERLATIVWHNHPLVDRQAKQLHATLAAADKEEHYNHYYFAGYDYSLTSITASTTPWSIKEKDNQEACPLHAIYFGYPHQSSRSSNNGSGFYLELLPRVYDTSITKTTTNPDTYAQHHPHEIQRVETQYNRLIRFDPSKSWYRFVVMATTNNTSGDGTSDDDDVDAELFMLQVNLCKVRPDDHHHHQTKDNNCVGDNTVERIEEEEDNPVEEERVTTTTSTSGAIMRDEL